MAGEGERPLVIGIHRLDEFTADEHGQVELAQPAGFALGADEFDDVGMTDVQRGHLGAAAAARRGDGEAGFVVNVHERQRPAGTGASATHIGPARAQRAEVIADAATGLQGQARLHIPLQDIFHGIADGAADRAVDQRGGGFVLPGAGVGHDAPGADRAVVQRPEEFVIPVIAVARFEIGQRPRHALAGALQVLVDGCAVTIAQLIFLRPLFQRDPLHGHVLALRLGRGGGVHVDDGGIHELFLSLLLNWTTGCSGRSGTAPARPSVPDDHPYSIRHRSPQPEPSRFKVSDSLKIRRRLRHFSDSDPLKWMNRSRPGKTRRRAGTGFQGV